MTVRPTALAAIALVAAGCGSDPEDAPRTAATSPAATTAAATPSAPPSRPRRTGTVIITADSDFGRMLYDASGQPIYLFDAERTSRPRCYGACAEAWPPVLTKGLPRARAGTREALLGTVRRTDGTRQVTYAGHPLYFYAHEGAYQVLCHDVTEFGGTWLVVRPDGTPAPG
jgi:predicted lipoprotein with Yx(FWY)xxD motif